MDYRWFIARRYLFSPKRFSVISFITGISIVGVAVGVTSLIVVLSVMNGFYDFVQDLLTSSDPDIRIESVSGNLAASDSLIGIVMAEPGVRFATPMVSGKALVQRIGADADLNKVVIVRGVDQDGFAEVRPSVTNTMAGEFDFSRQEGRAGMVVGFDLSERIGLIPAGVSRPATRVRLLSAPALERSLTQLWSSGGRTFEVRGLYDLQRVSDESVVYIDLADAQQLFRLKDQVSSIEVVLDDQQAAESVKAQLVRSLDPDQYQVRTWYDLQRTQYDAMKIEKWAASVILALIIVVAAFTIVGSLTMVVIEKRRDVGVLQALGVTRTNIRKIFLAEGVLLGSIGTAVGLVVGLLLVWVQGRYGIVPLAGAESFLINSYPVAVRVSDVVLVVIVALLLTVGASIYPAVRAASVEPASAIASDG